jgi:tRNA threonylcarbamoyladenosine biosynthesis protein TsaB
MPFTQPSNSKHACVKRPISFSNLLAVDTATNACSVALWKEHHLVIESTNVTRQTHSRHLLSMIENALTIAKMGLSDLDGFVVTKGPGSFTGLRIGISTVKGLARATNKPLVGISYLKCLAQQSAATKGLVCAMIDARRGELYYALYRFGDSGIKVVISESVGPLSDLVAKIEEHCLFIGNGIYENRKRLTEKLGQRALFALDFQHILRAETIIWAGQKRLENGQQEQIESFVPNYIRKSDAQINLANLRLSGSG